MDTVRSFESPADEMTFHPVGVAVKSIAAALGYYTGLFGLRQLSEPV